jgi:putative sigma-54 modulation protein
MKTIIQTIDFKARKTLTDFVEENLGKLESFSGRIVDCKVTLRLNKSDQQENKICEIKVTTPGHDFFASRESETFEDAVLKSIDAIRHQIERSKDSKAHKIRKSSVSMDRTGETE